MVEQKEKINAKNQESYEKLKDDPTLNSYLKRLQEASFNEAWKLFTLTKPLTGWKNDEKADTAEEVKLKYGKLRDSQRNSSRIIKTEKSQHIEIKIDFKKLNIEHRVLDMFRD